MRGIFGLLMVASLVAVIAGISAGNDALITPPIESLNILINERYSKWPEEQGPLRDDREDDVLSSNLSAYQVFSSNEKIPKKAKVEKITFRGSYPNEYFNQTNTITDIDFLNKKDLNEDPIFIDQLKANHDSLSNANSTLQFEYTPINPDELELYTNINNKIYSKENIERIPSSDKYWENTLSFNNLGEYEVFSVLEDYLKNSNNNKHLPKKSENINLSYYLVGQKKDISNLKSISETDFNEDRPLIDQIITYPNLISDDSLDLLSIHGNGKKTYNLDNYEAELPYLKLETGLNLKTAYEASIYESSRNEFSEDRSIADQIPNLNQLSMKEKIEIEGEMELPSSQNANLQTLPSRAVLSPEKPTFNPNSPFDKLAIPQSIPSFRNRDSGRLEKYAVIIGINKYDSRFGLHTCVNDANQVSDLLKGLGYNIIKITDETGDKPTKENILNKGLAQIEKKNDLEQVIIYYSGHGEVDDFGNFYLVPNNANKSISSCIGNEEIDRYTKNLDNLAIIIDACNSGAFRMKNRPGLLIIASSTGDEPSNEVWFGAMSVFTQNLIEAIKDETRYKSKNKIILQDCFTKAQNSTKEWSKRYYLNQNPKMTDLTSDRKYYLD